MNLSKFTQKAQEAVLDANALAVELGHGEIDSCHVLLALVRQGDGLVPAMLRGMEVPVNDLEAELRALLDRRAKVQGGSGPVLSRSTR